MTTDKQARKERPIARGVLDYFPDAIAEVAHVSFVGNQQHNPGQEMHWAKDKSSDHADCLIRHAIERGTLDDDGLRHSAKAAWRALAMLQIEIESSAKHPIQEYVEECTKAEPVADPTRHVTFGNSRAQADYNALIRLGCPDLIAEQIVDGTTYTLTADPACYTPYVYIAGPMRGYDHFNFPAFDAARETFVKRGFNVISPADIDRAAGDVNENAASFTCTQADFAFRDFWSLYFIAKLGHPSNGIVLLPGWEKSVGAAGEFHLGRWIKLKFYDQNGGDHADALHSYALAHCVAKP